MSKSYYLKNILVCYLFFFATFSYAQPIQELFKGAEAWLPAAEVSLSSNGKTIVPEGSGAILVGEGGKQSELTSKGKYSDAVVTLDFILAKNSSAYIYLHSRYGIALVDSEGKTELTDYDMGGLEQGKTKKNTYSAPGAPPLVNAAGRAGEWQSLEITFRGPRFNDAGTKTEPAFIHEVKINKQVVQANMLVPGITENSEKNREQASAPFLFRAQKGQIALRNFDVRAADLSFLQIPTKSGAETNYQELVDFVALGEKLFKSFGCQECHSVSREDKTTKSGPNLYGLFQYPAQEKEIIEAGEGHRYTIKADRNYILESIRHPEIKLALHEGGNAAKAYPSVMPAFAKEVLSDSQVEAIGDYLATLNHSQVQGPIVSLRPEKTSDSDDPLDDPFQFFVRERTRIQRGPMPGMSGRSIHVGLSNGVNYSFDPRLLAIVKLWQGGFLNMAGELENRGGGGLESGINSKNIDFKEKEYLLAPLNSRGELIDFSFKEGLFGSKQDTAVLLHGDKELEELVESVGAKFLGYTLDSKDPQGTPVFQYRIADNQISIANEIQANGKLRVIIQGDFNQTQKYLINMPLLKNLKVKGASLNSDELIISPGKSKQVELRATLALSRTSWKAKKTSFVYEKQKIVTREAKANLPAGYRVESVYAPKDNFGRDQLFEALAVKVAKNGSTVVGTRTAGIWRMDKGYWHLFAEGTFDSLGLVVDDNSGQVLTVGQKPELTRISDTNGDGRADSYKTLFDAFSYHGNYHSYMHGPVKTLEGKYYIALNLAHADDAYKAGGLYMGSFGGYSGWGMMVDKKGTYQTWVNGLRSPAGLGVSPKGKLYYTENQGEYVGSSKMFAIKKGGFYGHPSALVDLPGQKVGSKDILWNKVKSGREKAVLIFPHNHLANSPGNLEWNQSQGKFGVFDEQFFIGDQTLSSLFRVVVQEIKGVEQGVVIPFANKLESGVMRPVFLGDGSLMLGQTGRGWQAKGGKLASLQKITWDGKTLPKEIFTVNIQPEGFEIIFTAPTEAFHKQDISITSWRYQDTPDYGSPELGKRIEQISDMTFSENRKVLKLKIKRQREKQYHPEQTARVYHISLQRKAVFNDSSDRKLEAWYTVNLWPDSL